MATDRVSIEDEALEEELGKVDWRRLLQYGKIEITVRDGEWTSVTRHPTTQNRSEQSRSQRRRPG